MRSVPVSLSNHVPIVEYKDGLVTRSVLPVVRTGAKDARVRVHQSHDQDSDFLQKTLSRSRVLVVEGISGSGKDTFQNYLIKQLKGRDVYDYSEGDVLSSWNQLQIGGIFELRVKFMKLFVNYVKDVVSRDENAVFLLNRFHLSAYASTITQQPKLEPEYDEIISVLRMLPIHVFILQLDDNEIEKRSSHPERSGAWRRFKDRIDKDGFCDRLERQQRLIIEVAKKQQLPYSLIKVFYEPEIRGGQVRISDASSVVRGKYPETENPKGRLED